MNGVKATNFIKKEGVNSSAMETLLSFGANGVQVRSSKSKGKHLLAKKSFQIGDLLVKERPVTSAVSSECASEYCTFCWNLLDSKGKKEPKYCPESKYVAYCSSSCLEMHKSMHEQELPLLKEELINQLTFEEGALKVEYYIMAIRAVIGKYLETKGEQPDLYVKGHYESLCNLFVNPKIFSKLDKRIFKKGAAKIASYLPVHLSTSALEIEHILAVFNCYQYEITPLSNPESNALKVPVLAVFPYIWQNTRHSCVPNAHFYAALDGTVCVRALQPISEGEEVVLSFTDLYTGRIDRWVLLATTKYSNHYVDAGKKRVRIGRCCHCSRCKGSLDKSSERFLQGFLCRQCGKDVYVARDKDGAVVEDIVFYQDNATKASDKAAPLPANDSVPEAEEKIDASGPSSEASEGLVDESKLVRDEGKLENDGEAADVEEKLASLALDDAENSHIATFKCCNCDHELPALVYQQIENEVQNDYSLSFRCFQEQAFDLAYKIYAQFIQRYERDLRLILNVNPLLFHSRLYIMHAAEQANDLAAALQAAKELLQTIEKNGFCPQYSPDRAEIYYKMSTLMHKLAKEKAGKQTKGELMYVKKMVRDAKEMYAKALEQVKWAYGDDYPMEKLVAPTMPPTSQVTANGSAARTRKSSSGR